MNQLKEQMFDQKSHYELGNHRIDSLLKPECMSSVNLANDMSFNSPSNNEESSIFNFNFNSCERNEESFIDEDVENVLSTGQQYQTHSVDFGLRVESQRAGFASKYLFNKTSGPDVVEEVDEEDSYDNEESYSSADYSNSVMTEGHCSNFSVAVASPDSSVEPINSTTMQKF